MVSVTKFADGVTSPERPSGLSNVAKPQEISERKKSIIVDPGNVAELGAGRMEETIGKASLRDAAIGTGIAVDKMLALTGQTPALQIANIVMPTRTSAPNVAQLHEKLDAIARRLTAQASCSARTRAIAFLSRFISLAVTDRRVIPIRA